MKNRYIGQLSTDVLGETAAEGRVARLSWNEAQAAAADDSGVHAAITGDVSEETVITTEIAALPCARNITVKSGGTTADVKAGDITVFGYNMAGEEISEAFTFTANENATKIGNKAFKEVTKIIVPAQDGAAATFTIGFGSKLGLPFMLDSKPPVFASLNGTLEATAPTITNDADEVEKNTILLNSALAADSPIELWLLL